MKKLNSNIFVELANLPDTIQAGFRAFYAKSTGFFVKKSDGTEQRLMTSDDVADTFMNNKRAITATNVVAVLNNYAYFAIVQTTTVNPGKYSGLFKITAYRGSAPESAQIMYVNLQGDGIYTPAFQANVQTNATLAGYAGSAAYNPVVHFRLIYPKSGQATNRRCYFEVSVYSNWSRTIKVELIEASGIELCSVPLPASTYNATYDNVSTYTACYQGIVSSGSGYFSVSGTSWATNSLIITNYPAGENIGTGDLIYLDSTLNSPNGRWRKAVANAVIPPETTLGIAYGAYNTGTNVGVYTRTFTTFNGMPTVTSMLGHEIYLRGTINASGNFVYDGMIVKGSDMTTGYAYLQIGRAGLTTNNVFLYEKNDIINLINSGDFVIDRFNRYRFDAKTLEGLSSSAFAKIGTAFTSFGNIAGNNADCAVVVIDTSIEWSSTEIKSILTDDIQMPTGTTSMVLILQPGIYEIVGVIDFASYNVRAIIGLCPDSTIINVEDTSLIINLELIENLTINIAGSTAGHILENTSLSKAEAHNLKIKYVGSLGYDAEINCFAEYTNITNCTIESIIGIAFKSRNITNVKHTCLNINNYNGLGVLTRTQNVSNFSGMYSLPIAVGGDSINLSNFLIEFSTADDQLRTCFEGCVDLSNIRILNCDIGFGSCGNISNAIVETDAENTGTAAYSNCILLSNCKAIAYIGFGGCNNIVSSEASSCNIGFYSSAKISLSRGSGCTTYGFDSCTGMVQNNSDNYNSCFADSNAIYAVADTPGGGFNS